MTTNIPSYVSKRNLSALIAGKGTPTEEEAVFMAMYIIGREQEVVTPEEIHEWLGWGNTGAELVNDTLHRAFLNGYLSARPPEGKTKFPEGAGFQFAPEPEGTFRFALVASRYSCGDYDSELVSPTSGIAEKILNIFEEDDKDWRLVAMPLLVSETKLFEADVIDRRYNAVAVDKDGNVVWEDEERRIPVTEMAGEKRIVPPESTKAYEEWLQKGFGHTYTPVAMSKVLKPTIAAKRYIFRGAYHIHVRNLADFMYLSEHYLRWDEAGTTLDERWGYKDLYSTLWGSQVRYVVMYG